MHLVVFEDPQWTDLAPLCFARPACLLRCGGMTLLERAMRALAPAKLTLWCREPLALWLTNELAPTMPVPTTVNRALDDEPTLLLNARLLAHDRVDLEQLGKPHVATDARGAIAHALVRAPGLGPLDALAPTDRFAALCDLPEIEPVGTLVNFSWDLLTLAQPRLSSDAMALDPTTMPAIPTGTAHVVGDRDAVRVSPTARLAPGVVLDASNGPIAIHADAVIGANSVIEGPCWIGPHSSVLPLTLVRAGTILGPVCKVGGEISNTTLLAFSNKQHHGFIGDSYLGEWVNLGAGTVTGNLKNTLGEIRMQIGRRTIPTGRQFLGAIIGDHARSATGTLLPAGCYVGYACHLSGPLRPSRFCGSGTMLSEDGSVDLDRGKAEQIAAGVYQRRARKFEPWHAEVMRYAFEAARRCEWPQVV